MTRPLLLALLALALTPAAAAAAPCTETDTLGDTDGDLVADLLVGLPAQNTVSVFESHAPLEGVPNSGAAGYGTGVALADVTGDECADALVGTPSRGVEVHAGSQDSGISYVAPLVLSPPGGIAGTGDEFGAAIAVSHRSAGKMKDLWIGAPATAIDGTVGAGAIHHYVIRPGRAPELLGQVTLEAPELPGKAAANDRFGRVLSPTVNGVVAGVPGHGKAGAVFRVRIDPAKGTLIDGQRVRGRKPGERFGAAVDANARGFGLVVGSPGARRNRGAVTVFGTTQDLIIGRGERYTRAAPRRGDRFGASVAVGAALGGCQERNQWAAGAPGADVRNREDAGAVTIGATGSCKATRVRAPGGPRGGDRFGAAMSVLRSRDDVDEDTRDRLAIAVPGRGLVLARDQELQLGVQGFPVIAIPESGSAR